MCRFVRVTLPVGVALMHLHRLQWTPLMRIPLLCRRHVTPALPLYALPPPPWMCRCQWVCMAASRVTGVIPANPPCAPPPLSRMYRHQWVRKAASRVTGVGMALPQVAAGLWSKPTRAAELSYALFMQARGGRRGGGRPSFGSVAESPPKSRVRGSGEARAISPSWGHFPPWGIALAIPPP